MWLEVLLTATLLTAYCDTKKCFTDIEKLRCWCRGNDDQTIFRIIHQKNETGAWLVEYNITDEACKSADVTGLLPPEWTDKVENINHEESNPCQERDLVERLSPFGYQVIVNSMYKLHPRGTYWDYARRTCINEGAHLAIINSVQEAIYLSALVRNSRRVIQGVEQKNSVFIGFHDIYQEGEFLTIFGEPLSKTGFNIWVTGKPDNRKNKLIGLAGNDCGGLTDAGRLTDVGCDYYHAFICEAECSDYAAPDKIDYSKSSFSGIELTRKPPQGTKVRVKPGFGYKLQPGFSFYRFHTTPVVWHVAMKTCEREGAYLVDINSERELQVLNAIIRQVPKRAIIGSYLHRYVSVGFHCLFKPRKFVTIFNGSVLNTPHKVYDNHWASSSYIGEYCGSVQENGNMDDIDCHMNNIFICEKDVLE